MAGTEGRWEMLFGAAALVPPFTVFSTLLGTRHGTLVSALDSDLSTTHTTFGRVARQPGQASCMCSLLCDVGTRPTGWLLAVFAGCEGYAPASGCWECPLF